MASALFKAIRKAIRIIKGCASHAWTNVLFWGNGVKHRDFHTNGTPFISVARRGKCTIGADFHTNNGITGNPIGTGRKCILFVDNDAELTIGNHVGLSQCALVSTCQLTIEDYVKIGGGTSVVTTDFHSLTPDDRIKGTDIENRTNAPITIKRNAFIGMNCIILKGVTIGENSVVGAGSVVTTSIPDNEIWAGNPAKLVRKI